MNNPIKTPQYECARDAGNWPGCRDYSGTCHTCHLLFMGTKAQIMSRTCRICHAHAAPPAPPAPRGVPGGADTQPKTGPEPSTGRTGVWRFTIPGDVCGKPRQTQSDRWKKRPAVMRYRAWADAARAAAPKDMTSAPLSVSLVAHIRVPKSYSLKKAKALAGQPHRQKPDLDNVIKLLDALFADDKGIAHITARKVWTLEFARLEVEVAL